MREYRNRKSRFLTFAAQSLTSISKYESPIIKIIVGDEEAVFFVHEGLLRPTTFFAKHGHSRREHPDVAQERDQDDEHTMFVNEGQNEALRATNNSIDLTNPDADYELKDKFFYRRDAFDVFVSHLSGATLKTPQSQEECTTLFRTFALGQEYGVSDLQNNVIEALQKYYLGHTIPITDLIWVVDRFGDDPTVKLVSYLIAQSGYDMGCKWQRYENENPELDLLLASGKKRVLKKLFEACAIHAVPAKNGDPARSKNNWRTRPN